MFEVVIFWPLDFLCDTCSLSRLKWEGMGGEPDPREREVAIPDLGTNREVVLFHF